MMVEWRGPASLVCSATTVARWDDFEELEYRMSVVLGGSHAFSESWDLPFLAADYLTLEK